jgi:excinuclease UvrABC nuclease subunit
MAKKMLISRLIQPYLNTGKANIPNERRPGTYLIYKNNQLMYVGYSGTSLYKTMYRHFQKWSVTSLNKQTRHVYDKKDLAIKVRIIYTRTAYEANKLEKALILKYNPKDNENKYKEEKFNKIYKQAADTFINEPKTDISKFKGEVPF